MNLSAGLIGKNLNVVLLHITLSAKKYRLTYILTHTSNAKLFGNVTLIYIRGLGEIIIPFRGHGRHSLNQAMIQRECLTDEVLLSFS